MPVECDNVGLYLNLEHLLQGGASLKLHANENGAIVSVLEQNASKGFCGVTWASAPNVFHLILLEILVHMG